MYLDSAIIGLSIEDNITHVKHLEIKSPVLSMTGAGSVNIPKNSIDMTLNLITKAKTNISKIPLLGYILTGKEQRPSIALQVSGDLNKPDVKNTVFKEVATLPLSLLYRTLTLPVHMANTVVCFGEDNDETTDKAGNTKVEKDSKE